MSEKDFDLQRSLIEQRQKAEQFMRDLDEVGNGDVIAMWFAPPGMENYHWYRCGVRHTDGSMPPLVARMYHKHRAMGAQDAPKGMRPPLGFERDGNLGVYVWYSPETYHMLQEVKKRVARKRPTPADVMQRELGSGVELTVSKGYDKPRRGSR